MERLDTYEAIDTPNLADYRVERINFYVGIWATRRDSWYTWDMNLTKSMKADWNARAEENAYHWVSSKEKTWDKDAYYKSGEENFQHYVQPFLDRRKISDDQLKGFTVLDIGSGTGRHTRAFAKRCSRAIGIDVSEEMIKKAHEDNANIANVAFHITNGQDFSAIDSDSIDLCFSFIVFQHFPTKEIVETYFKEMKRVLKPGGHIQIQVRGVPGNPPGKVLWFLGLKNFYIALCLWRGFLPVFWMHKYDSIYGAVFSNSQLRSLAAKNGFEDIYTEHPFGHYLWIDAIKP